MRKQEALLRAMRSDKQFSKTLFMKALGSNRFLQGDSAENPPKPTCLISETNIVLDDFEDGTL